MSQSLNRRSMLKQGLLTLGGTALLPTLGWGETPSTPLPLNSEGKVVYTPLFKEHTAMVAAKLVAKLNANENPYGPSPKSIKALKDAADAGNRYGWGHLSQLVDMIAEKEGVSKEHIMMGPGSSDLLEKFALVYFMNGGTVLSADPSYMSLMNVARSVGAEWKGVTLNKDWSHDLDAMEKAITPDTKMVYICNPNNPTGTITSYEKLKDFCSRVSEKVPVFVDEAYLEFVEGEDGKSMVSLLNEGKNVIVARTFSKIHGMAGLRVGYVAALPETLEAVQKITRGGMGISNTSIYAAIASMKDTGFQDASRLKNKEARDYTFGRLKEMGFDPVPSHTSFMIFPQTEYEGREFLNKMMAHGIGVRSFEIYDKTWCRVSMGTMKEMQLFTDALGKVIG
ncbi:pyridoxal phosphate-dependent aminotransferase [Roseivirga pacifica]